MSKKSLSKYYEIITNRIIEQLEKNVIPWRKPWQGGIPVNYITQKPYNGINLLLLPYGGEWLSFKQVQEVGGKVQKGEKSSMVVFFKMLEKQKDSKIEIMETFIACKQCLQNVKITK